MVLEKCLTPVRKLHTFARKGRKKQENRCFFSDMNEPERASLDERYFPSVSTEIYLFR
jgi:hypothetical protein